MTAKAWKADTSNTAKNRPVCRPLGPLPGSDHCRPGLISPGRDYVSPAGLSAQPGRIGHASPCSLCEQRFQSAQHLISRHPTLSVLENTHLPENQCEERWLHPLQTCPTFDSPSLQAPIRCPCGLLPERRISRWPATMASDSMGPGAEDGNQNLSHGANTGMACI